MRLLCTPIYKAGIRDEDEKTRNETSDGGKAADSDVVYCI
jgi:hypothetical protein